MTPGEPVSTTIGQVRTELELLNADRETFVRQLTAALPEKPPNYERIIDINAGRDAADEEATTELELGPNNCAATGDYTGGQKP